jgi:membrane protease YdiL (CAAX protease family)
MNHGLRGAMSALKRFIAALSSRAEFATVLVCAFGIPLIHSLLIAAHVVGAPTMSDGRLLRTLAFELVTLGALGAFLSVRGWTVERLGFSEPTAQDAIDGFGLLAVAYLVPAGIWLLLPGEIRQGINESGLSFAPAGLSLPIVALTSVVNPIFEEVFVVGYLFGLLGRQNRMMAINVSIALRLAYHLYQGASAVIFILPLGLVFAWWYSTRPRLWPLLLAHAALDLISLAAHVS